MTTYTNLPTSGFPAAASLTGAEIVGIVQSGSNVKTTVEAIAAYGGGGYHNSKSLAIGKEATTDTYGISIGYRTIVSGDSGIAIGYLAASSSANAIAVGRKTAAAAGNTIAIGYKSYGTNENAISIGSLTGAYQQHSIAIGYKSYSNSNTTVTIGYDNTNSAVGAVVIGSDLSVSGRNSIIIGNYATTYSLFDVAIGNYIGLPESFGSVCIGTGIDMGAKYGVCVGSSNSCYGKGAMTIGAKNNASADYSIVIGYGGTASSTETIAIGRQAKATAVYATAIGYHAYAYGEYSIAIGASAKSLLQESIAIGTSAYAKTAHGLAIGNVSYSSAAYAIAIGGQARAMAPYAVAIGYHSETSGISSVAIGGGYCSAVRDAVSVGNSSRAKVAYGIAIGSGSYVQSGSEPSIAIGPGSTGSDGGVAIGAGSVATQFSVAIGTETVATVAYSISIMGQANGNYSLAIGTGSNASYNNSIAFGNGATSVCETDFTVRGGVGNHDGVIAPSTHAQKFFGTTLAAVPSVATWTDGGVNWRIFVVNIVTDGTAGNSQVFNVVDTTGTPNSTLAITLAGDDSPNTVVLTLGTDSDGNVTTTLQDAITFLEGNGFGFAYNIGSGSVIVSDGVAGTTSYAFSGGADAVTTAIITTDGNSPGENNLPAVQNLTISRMTGQVVGYNPELLTGGGGDSATFILDPTIIIRDIDANYTLIGTATFTLETSSEGAAGWTVPTLTVVDSDQLYITVAGEDPADINWLGFISFESTQ